MPRSVQPGNHVKVGRGLYSHHGIYMGERDGVHLVAELAKPGEGGVVRMISWQEFSQGSGVELVYHPDGLPLPLVVENVFRAPRWRTYDLLDWNCEHFATWCSTHEARSDQVRTAIGGGVVVLFVALLALAS